MSSSNSLLLDDLINFLNSSPTAWHAVEEIRIKLLLNQFKELKESDKWSIEPGGSYFVRRNGSSLGAFVVPLETPQSVIILGSHTDSPSLKIKPQSEFIKENMLMLGVEIYGAPLLTSWMNRDLGIAGKVVYRDQQKNIQEALITLDSSPVVIPQLAIHLDRTVNETGLIINKQEHLAALAALIDGDSSCDKEKSKHYLKKLIQEKIGPHPILGHDLFLFPLEKARFIGNQKEMISSYRLDNLGGAHAVLQGVLSAKPHSTELKTAFFWDHEEIGSCTAQGAGSPFLPQLLERLSMQLKMTREEYFRLIHAGFCVSVDLTHATHPNYMEKHEPRHQIFMNGGVVIKSNAQHRYASSASTQAQIVAACQDNQIPFQHFVSRNDIAAGTTLGPITANLLGIQTVDIGYPQLSMHSCRELASCKDHLALCQLLQALLDK